MSIRDRLDAPWRNMAYRNRGALRWLGPALIPAGWLYGLAAASRRRLFELGVFRAGTVPVPVVSVGNITVGGVGKTPFAAYLAKCLSAKGWNPAIATRGYRREGVGIEVLTKESFDIERVRDYGDEAALLHFATGFPVAIGRNRAAAVRRLLETAACDVVLLDDGFQHLKLKRELDMVLLDGANPLGNGRCLPAGPLREPARSVGGAGALVFRGPANEAVRGALSVCAPAFSGKLAWREIRPFRDWINRAEGRGAPPDGFPEKGIALLSGIGAPERLEADAESHGYRVEAHFRHPDHHWFTAGELLAASGKGVPVLCTEKDAIRLVRPIRQAALPPSGQPHVIMAGWTMDRESAFLEWLDRAMEGWSERRGRS